jgi:hypothetical protein
MNFIQRLALIFARPNATPVARADMSVEEMTAAVFAHAGVMPVTHRFDCDAVEALATTRTASQWHAQLIEHAPTTAEVEFQAWFVADFALLHASALACLTACIARERGMSLEALLGEDEAVAA